MKISDLPPLLRLAHGRRRARHVLGSLVALVIMLGFYPAGTAWAYSSPTTTTAQVVPDTSGTHCSAGGNICIDVYGTALNVNCAQIWTRNHNPFENGIVVMAVFPPGTGTSSNNSQYWWWSQAEDNYNGSGPNSFYINFQMTFESGTQICGFDIGGDNGRPCITVS